MRKKICSLQIRDYSFVDLGRGPRHLYLCNNRSFVLEQDLSVGEGSKLGREGDGEDAAGAKTQGVDRRED